jgi:hypothetical protein
MTAAGVPRNGVPRVTRLLLSLPAGPILVALIATSAAGDTPSAEFDRVCKTNGSEPPYAALGFDVKR